MNTTINIGEFAGVVGGIIVAIEVVKRAFPAFPARLVPLLTLVLAVPAYLTLVGGWDNPQQYIAAFVASVTATGTYSGIRATVTPDQPKQ